MLLDVKVKSKKIKMGKIIIKILWRVDDEIKIRIILIIVNLNIMVVIESIVIVFDSMENLLLKIINKNKVRKVKVIKDIFIKFFLLKNIIIVREGSRIFVRS